jgi:glycosyltransferase involved in cell wall biosynthesis
MSILYLLTTPPPLFEGTDAVQQEVAALCDAFDGKAVNLSPLKTTIWRFPKQLFGLHKIAELRALERECKATHVFFSMLYPFPILRLLRNPIFYTVAGSLESTKKPAAFSQLEKLRGIVVSNLQDAAILGGWGLRNYTIIPPGIDASALVPSRLPLGRELILLMASAPWNGQQFELKGIDLLLAVAVKLPYLRLILLWRGVLADELEARVQRFGLQKRVEIVNRKVKINDYLRRAHATVLLAKRGGIVKSFPHSLLESLVVGKPVLLSDTIAMSDYVSKHQCGVVVREMSLEALAGGIEALMRDYEGLARNSAQIGPAEFSINTMIENYRRLYAL